MYIFCLSNSSGESTDGNWGSDIHLALDVHVHAAQSMQEHLVIDQPTAQSS